MRKSLLLLGLTLCLWPLAAQAQIADNSFLVEEAYNQEPGVVQHINTLMRDRHRNLYYSLSGATLVTFGLTSFLGWDAFDPPRRHGTASVQAGRGSHGSRFFFWHSSGSRGGK